jgi:hypothetical protein
VLWSINYETALQISYPLAQVLKDDYVNPISRIKKRTIEAFHSKIFSEQTFSLVYSLYHNIEAFLFIQPLLDGQNYLQFDKWTKKDVGKAFTMAIICFLVLIISKLCM